MKVRLALGCLLVGGCVVGAPVSSASPSPVIRIAGESSGYVDVVLTRPTTLNEAGARLSTEGTYVAWWMTKLGEKVHSFSNQAGGVRWVDYTEAGRAERAAVDLGMKSGPLEPGRYRLYLATDGASVVEIQAAGLTRSLDVSPVRRVASGGRAQMFDLAPGGIVKSEDRNAVPLPAGALAVSSATTRSAPGLTVRQLTACVTPVESECQDRTTASGYTSSIFGEHMVQFSAIYSPGDVPAGPADFLRRATAGPGVVEAAGSFFWLATAT